MGFFTNLRLRRKLLVAMVPLILMVLAAGVYSSFESKMIDTWYSALIDGPVKALRSVEEARAHTNRFGLFLFELVNETDSDRKQVLDGNLQRIGVDYHSAMAKALELSPDRAVEINAASAVFDRAESDARPVRAAALAGDNVKALDLLRGNVNQELQSARQANIGIIGELQQYIDKRSDDLTINTRHAILITWLVIGFGLLASWAAAFYICKQKWWANWCLCREASRIRPTDGWTTPSRTSSGETKSARSPARCVPCRWEPASARPRRG